MPIALDPMATFSYILKEERAKPGLQTKFFLRPLTGADAKLVMRAANAEESTSDALFDAVTICLAGWECFCDAIGKEVPFETEERVVRGRKRVVVKASSMDRLNANTITELATAISNFNGLTPDDVKN